MHIVFVAILSFWFVNCSTSRTSPVVTSKDTVMPGSAVSRSGSAVKLIGSGTLRVGTMFPEVTLIDDGFQSRHLSGKGGVRLVSVVPSVDTKVCEEQTHILGESSAIHPAVERITVSRDLPMAQKRFATDAKLINVTYLSDFQEGAFGRGTGLLMEGSGLLARAVLVIDQDGFIRHLQVVPDVAMLPDLDAAIAVANRLAAK